MLPRERRREVIRRRNIFPANVDTFEIQDVRVSFLYAFPSQVLYPKSACWVILNE